MTNETVTKSGRFYCVSVTPDICKTPVGASTPPLPYTIVGEFSDAAGASPNVKSHSEPVVLHGRTTIPTVKGDAPGTAGGVKSGTVGKQVDTKAHSPTHHANGADLVQVGREVWMNQRNTVGKIYERGGESARPLLAQLSKQLDDGLAQVRESLKPAAQIYRDDVSAPLHDVGERLMDAGGKVALGGGAIAATGGVVSATLVGAPVGVPMAAGGAAVAGVGGAAATGGAVMDSAATVLDQGAEYVLTGKVPDLRSAAFNVAISLAEGLVLNKLGPLGRWLGSKAKGVGPKAIKKLEPGTKPHVSKTPAEPPAKPPVHHEDDGKSKGKKEPKSEPPSECCPKNKAPANKPVKSKKPVHFGTGQEVLHQSDFVTSGAIPINWTRCYRSGAETEDRGLLGARWSSAFTTSVSLTAQGCVYHDETGRALRLPHLAPGQSHDEMKEGFVLARKDDATFTLTWRDGSCDTFTRGADDYLPHGYDGVNPMLDAGAPLRVERFVLSRSVARDGRGIGVATWLDALPGELLLRVTTDDGAVVEAMRADLPGPPCIERVEEVLEDGTRIRHTRYCYEGDAGQGHDLVSQTNVLGSTRTYTYHHHLLTACTGYTGFLQLIEWVSLAALRARWSGSALDDAELAATYPITPDNSYQARATASRAADGSEGPGIALTYLDIDTTRVTENGDVLDYTFDRNWLVTCVSRLTGGVAKRLGTREWDRNGMLLADTDSLGRTTRFDYDAAGNVISSTDAAGHTTRIAYDEANQPVSVADPMGHITRRSYDAAGRLVSVTNALGHTSSFRYDDKGQLVEQVDAKGGVSRFEYDKAGHLRTSTDCSGRATKYRYDERGRVAAVIHAEAAPGQQTRYIYDALGRLTMLTRPDGTSESYTYDADGNLVAHTDALGHQTRYRYNGQGLLVERIDAIGQTVRYRYDTALRLVELANAKDERYLLAYDADGALTSETGFDGKVTSYTYDQAGQLTASECAGQRTELIRDTRGQLVAKINADGIVRFAYDELGRMVAVAAPQAEHRFAYDPLGQLIDERAAYYLVSPPVATPVDGSRVPDAAFVMTHAYDELGNRISTTLPNGRRVDTLRYGSGHWHSTLWQGKAIVDVERDKLHRETKRQMGRGPETQRMVALREYDPQSRVSAMTLTAPGAGSTARTLRERRFTYDPVGNLLSIDQQADAYAGAANAFTYSYDPVGQLMSAVQRGLTETFVFDPAGNLLDPALPQLNDGPAPTSVAQASNVPKLPTITANLLKTLGGHSYRYDAQGNVIAKHSAAGAFGNGSHASEIAFEYDAENRLRRSIRNVQHRRDTAEYFYDAFSRRVAKRVTAEKWRNTQQPDRDVPESLTYNTLFVWDGDTLAQEFWHDSTVTFLYEPNSFVPMARVASSGGQVWLRQEFGPLPDAKAVNTAETSNGAILSSNDNACVNPNQFRSVMQWMLPGPLHATDCDSLKSPEESAEKKFEEAWQHCQLEGGKAALSDRIDYYNCDHLGTAHELIDENGRVIWASPTRAWGRALSSTSYETNGSIFREVSQPLRFQGQYEDVESGLFYNRYRYYDPDVGRYITQDPIGLLGGLNSYAYAPNTTGWYDPTGLKSTCPVTPNCDPCVGKKPAAWARQWQGHGAYKGRDDWTIKVLSEGTEIYGGAPGQSGFYFDQSTLDKSGGSKSALWQSLQVLENKKFGYRPAVQKYRLKKDTCVAVSIAQSQISTTEAFFGAGGGTQYFLSDFKKRLQPVGPRILLK